MAAAIRAEELTKFYGSRRGVLELSFEVEQGEIFGFLGPNGAGKTTTIRLMLDLLRPTSGRVELFGSDPRRDVSLRRRIGYLPGDLRLYERLTAEELFEYFGSLRGLDGLAGARGLAERLELEVDHPIRALSRGNKQKVGIVQAFMHDPDLLILDEPTSGLDPLIQQEFYGLLEEAVARGATAFFSSHVLPEVQRVAGRVGLIRDGRLVLVEEVESLRARAAGRVEATFGQPPPPGAFAGLPGVREVSRHGHTVLFSLDGEVDPLVKALARYRVLAIDSHEADLEDVFLSLYAAEDEADAA